MKIVFFGASKFGLRCLERLNSVSGVEIAGVVTTPRKFSISYSSQGVDNVLHADFSDYTENSGIPLAVLESGMKMKELESVLRNWKPDLMIVVGWYHMFPKSILGIAPVAGLHASLLPDYSGGAPLVWAIINGERKTGITFFMFDETVDGGDIIGQVEEPIYLNDTIATLYDRIEKAGLALLDESIGKYIRNQVAPVRQDESRRRIMPQRSPDDGLIDWSNGALDVYNFIRAQTKPYPGAFTYFRGARLTVWECKLYDASFGDSQGNEGAGIIMGVVDEGLIQGILVSVSKMDHPLLITQVGLETGEDISGVEFAKRNDIQPGETLG